MLEPWNLASPQHEGAEGKTDKTDSVEGPEGEELALPETAGVACELEPLEPLEPGELPSPHYGFKRSVTSPLSSGPPLIEDLPVRSLTAPAVAGPSSMSYPDVEPWELPSPQHSGFHRAVTEPAVTPPASVEGALQKRTQLHRAVTDPAVCHREGGPSLPAVMIIVPVTVAVVPMVINRMQ